MKQFDYSVQDWFMIALIGIAYSLHIMLLRHIRYLLAVATHQNFTRAAEALHVSQPTLSQQIRQLEARLQVQLLDRSGRAIRLTDAGEAYLQHARRALRELDAGQRAIADVADLRRGALRLAMTPTFSAYLVGPLLARFNARYPGITLYVREMSQDGIEAELADDGLDVGIGFAQADTADIVYQPLFVETLSVVVGLAHAHAGRHAPLAARELGEQGLVLLSSDFATRRHIDQYCQLHGIVPRIAVEANGVGAIIDIVRRGQHATVLPDAIAREQHGLHALALDPPMAQRKVALLRRAGAYRSAASVAFADMLADGATR